MSRAAGAPVVAIAVPTPLPVGPINVYLVHGEPPMLIDAGIRTPQALAALEAGLAAEGVPLSAIGRILLTHGHLDHFGLARAVRERSGAEVWCHAGDAPGVEGWPGSIRRASARYGEYSAGFGFPPELYARVESWYMRGSELAEPVPVARRLGAGDTFECGGRRWEVLHTPGHTPGSVCCYQKDLNLLLSGDTVLAEITPNPFFGGHCRTGRMGLTAYRGALDRLAGLGAVRVLPGHGPPAAALDAEVRRIRVHHAERGARILSVIAGGTGDLYEVSRLLFPDLPLSEVWLAFAEVLGHVEVLEAEGRVRRRGGAGVDGPVRFEAVGEAGGRWAVDGGR